MQTKLAAEYDATISAEKFQELLVNLDGGDQEQVKTASALATGLTRRRLRELAFVEQILPSELAMDSDLAYLDDTEYPVIICEMESEIAPARTVPFGSATELYFPVGSKFRVTFSEHHTPDFQKNVYLLKAYKNDLRQIVTDMSLKDMDTERDSRFIATVDEIVGNLNGTGVAGVTQYNSISGAVSRETFVELKRPLQDRQLDVGCYLFNRQLLLEFEKMGMIEVGGGDLSSAMFVDGAKAAIKGKLFGVQTVVTIKRDLVPDNVVYQFAPTNFLGKHYRLDEIKVDVKRERDIITWAARCKTGFTIANVAAVNKSIFQP
jgi:hypothetical protein